MMNRNLCRFAAAMALVAASAAYAGDWEFSLGATYRSFDDVEFDSVQFENPAFPATALGGPYVNGTYFQVGVIQQVTVVDTGTQVVPLGVDSVASLDSIAFAGSSDTQLDETGAGLLEATTMLYQKDAFTLGLTLSLTGLWSDLSETIDGTAVTYEFQVGGPVNTTMPVVTQLNGGDPQTAGMTTEGRLEYDLDVYALTFGAGLTGRATAGPVALSLGAGPTLTLAHLEADVDEIVEWNQGLLAGQQVYADDESADETAVLAGFYGSVGISFKLSERIWAGAEYRYDYVIDDLASKIVDVDLTGHSGTIKVTYDF